MAGVKGSVGSGEVSLTAATAKTVLQLVAASNHRVKVTGLSIFFKGTSSTDTPAKVRVCKQTTTGTMSAATPVKRGDFGETLQTTAQHTATAEPTITDVYEMLEIHPQTGLKVFYPLGEELVIPGGGRLGVEITAAQGQTVAVNADFDE
jgi:hypothetical protein